MNKTNLKAEQKTQDTIWSSFTVSNELVIKNIRPFLVFMEEFHLPHYQVSLQEGFTLHVKILSNFYCDSKPIFLVNDNFGLQTLKRPYDKSKLHKEYSRLSE